MSVNTNQYIMLGVNLPFITETEKGEKIEPYHDNDYKKTVHEKDGLTVVSDGVNGDFTMVGKVLERSNLNETLDGPIKLLTVSPALKRQVAKKISSLFSIKNPDVQLWFFTHYH